MNRTRRITGGVLAAAALLLTAACGSGSDGSKGDGAGEKSSGKPDSAASATAAPAKPMAKMPAGTELNLLTEGRLTVCQGIASDPFFRSHDGSELLEEGFEVDMLKLVAERLGADPDISSYPSYQPTHLEEVMGGRVFEDKVCDIVAGVSADSPKSFPDVSFSVPYFSQDNAILEKAGAGYTSLDKLAGKRVGAIDSGEQDDIDTYNSKHGQQIKVTRLGDPQALYAQLRGGQLDAVVIGRAMAMNTATEHKDWHLDVGGTFGTPFQHMYAVKKGDTALLTQVNAALADSGTNGQYAKAYRTWFGAEPKTVPTAP